jgi:hypothetical protein
VKVAADPEALHRYATAAHRLDDDLARVGRALAADLAALPPSVAGPAGEVAAALAALGRAESATTRWVGATGLAFAAADAGRLTAWMVDRLVHLAGRGGHAGSAAADIEALLASGASPSVLAAAAVALGPEALLGLLAARPDLVGPVDGMPVEARYAANALLVARALAHETDPRRRAHLTALLAPRPGSARPRQILLFDPRGDGRVAEVFGRLDGADAVAVLVPGVSTDLLGFDVHVADPARRLARRIRRQAGGRRTAVDAWLGYDPPDGVVADPVEVVGMAGTAAARAGGRRLTALVDGLGLAPEARVTLIGHSYGSTTVGAALLDGARADRVVVLGSPGVLVGHGRDLGRPGTDLFAMEAPGDPVAELGWFGGDPNQPGSGFRRLDTGGSGHSSYLAEGSTAQANLAAVVLDQDERLDLRGPSLGEVVTAPGREASHQARRAGDAYRRRVDGTPLEVTAPVVDLGAEVAEQALDQPGRVVDVAGSAARSLWPG